MTPTIGVLALQGDVREHLAALERVGAAGRAVRREAELDGLHGIVLPGGESTTMDKLMRAFGLRDPLRAALRAGLPAYGSCAGMILLADRVLDGPAGPGDPRRDRHDGAAQRLRPAGGVLRGRRRDRRASRAVRCTGCSSGRPGSRRSGRRVEVLARVEEGEAAGRIVAVRQGSLLATSFHPEMTGDGRVHELFVRIVKERQT